MSPHRQMSSRSSRNSSAGREIEESFLGLAFKLHPQSDGKDDKRDLEYAMVVHDGTGVVEGETFTMQVEISGKNGRGVKGEVLRVSQEVLGRVRQYEKDRHVKVCMVALAEPFPEELTGHDGIETFATIWLHLDAIPFVTTPATAILDRLPIPSPEASASSAISAGLKHLHPVSFDRTLYLDAVTNLLLDFHIGKAKLARHVTNKDPNTLSEEWVEKYNEPVPTVDGNVGATSEDFWTVGNAIKWMYLATQVLDIPLHGVGEVFGFEKGSGSNVWKMAMGDDVKEGEGAVI